MGNFSAYTLLRCPNCDEVGQMLVLDSRAVRSTNSVRRRRRCDACGHRFTTHERLDDDGPGTERAIEEARGALQLALDRLNRYISSSQES